MSTRTQPPATTAAPNPRVVDRGGEEWWKEAVVYQIYPRSFADGNGDGVGDLVGLVSRLDYLAWLGVDVIWLSPVYPSPMDDHGYDISDYQDIDPLFGTLEEFDQLVAAIHERGMKLVMDLVVNHTSDEHPWFRRSRESRGSDQRDWYIWRPAREGLEPGTVGAEPNNWASYFGGSAWEYDADSGEHYLHLYSRKQPDLNWENPRVRHAVHSMMHWWLDRGVDGFRLDVINLISKDPSLPDANESAGGLPSTRYQDGSAHFVCGPRLHEFLQEMHREVFARRPMIPMTVGEALNITLDQAQLITDPARNELNMVFQFEHVTLDRGTSKWDHRPLRLTDLKASLGRWQTALSGRGWNSLYLGNHDQPRMVSRFGDDAAHRVESAKLLATVLYLHQGTPFIFQGDELGMTNMPFTGIEDFHDIESVNHFHHSVAHGESPAEVIEALALKSRDNARTPMQWSADRHAGFSTATPWTAVNPNYSTINAQAQMTDTNSVLHHYRRLIQLRKDNPVVVTGHFTMLLPDDNAIYAFTRSRNEEELLVIGNFTAEQRQVDLHEPRWGEGDVLLTNYSTPAVPGPESLVLRPWEALVLRHSARHLYPARGLSPTHRP